MSDPIANEVRKPRRWWKIWLKRLGLGMLALVGLVVLVLTLVVLFENWRGRRAWEAYRREAQARGVKLDLAPLIPPPIPDESNVAAIPMLAALFDYERFPNDEVKWKDSNLVARLELMHRFASLPMVASGSWGAARSVNLKMMETDLLDRKEGLRALVKQQTPAKTVLAAADIFRSESESIEVALKRTLVRFPIHYDEGYELLSPHLRVLQDFSSLFFVKSAAYLAEGRSAEAFKHVMLSSRCDEIVEVSATFPTFLVSLAMSGPSLNAVYQGLIIHQWNRAQLSTFEEGLRRRDPFDALAKTAQFQRAVWNQKYEQFRGGAALTFFLLDGGTTYNIPWLPSAVWFQNQLVHNRVCDSFDLEGVRKYGLGVVPEDRGINQFCGSFWPYHFFVRLTTESPQNWVKKTVRGRVSLDLAIVACVLERHRLAKGSYPEALVELVPDFTSVIPHDAASGGTLHYRREGDRFVLYSVGADLKDDNGRLPVGDLGDWVWRWPTDGK